jgi:hypothetical protein
MPRIEVKPMPEATDTTPAVPLVDMARLRLETVDAVVNWANGAVATIEKTMANYYVDSLEIDLTVPPAVKVTIRNKHGQSTSYMRP